MQVLLLFYFRGKSKSFFPAAVAVLSAALQVWPQTPDAAGRAVALFLDQNDDAALAELLKIRSETPQLFAGRDLDYLTGRIYENKRDFAAAAEFFETVRARRSTLRVYAMMHLAEIARSSGNLFLERLYLSEMRTFGAASLLSNAATERRVSSAFESGLFGDVIERPQTTNSFARLLPPLTPTAAVARGRSAAALVAQAKLAIGDTVGASALFEELIAAPATGRDEAAAAAARGLDAIDAAAGTQPSEQDAMRRAAIYVFERDFRLARTHYTSVVERSTDRAVAAKAILEIGRTFSQESNFTEAAVWLERAAAQTDDRTVAADALLAAASAYTRLGKQREAITRYQRFIDFYPADERAARANLNIVDALRDEGEDTIALQTARKIRDAYAGQTTATLALFDEAKIFIARSEWENALAALEALASAADLGSDRPGGTTAAEITFLRAYAFERLGRFIEAVDAYLSVPSGQSDYYCQAARNRLDAMAADAETIEIVQAKLNQLRQAPPARNAAARKVQISLILRLESDPPRRAALLREFRRLVPPSPRFDNAVIGQIRPEKIPAARLASLGLFDEAAPELEAALPAGDENLSNADRLRLIEMYAAGDRPDRAAAFLRRIWAPPADSAAEVLDPVAMRVFYPTPYKRELARAARESGVDPRLLLAIMRQESQFDPAARSDAGAVGLMQFITPTARSIAADLQITDFSEEDLFDPAAAIRFGGRYVENLFALFPEQPAAVAASYNAGEDNLKRWVGRARATREAERYVPEIAFAQTKDYVFRVIANYDVYKLLYDRDLAPRSSPGRR